MIGSRGPGWPLVIALLGLAPAGARGEEPPAVPPPTIPAPSTIPAPEVPPPIDPETRPASPTANPAPAPAPAPAEPALPANALERLEAIEARLRDLEEQNRSLSDENQELRRLIANPAQVNPATPSPMPMPTIPAPNAPDIGIPGMGARSLAEAAGPAGPPVTGSPSTPSTFVGRPPDSPVPSYLQVSPGRPQQRVPIDGSFGQGFQFSSEDEEFQLQVHVESQTDFRGFTPSGEGFARDGFYAPRNRIIFSGSVTRPVEYVFAINRGFGGLDLLDGFLNLRYDERFQLKIGRFMSAQNYEQFAIQNMWLIAPERSLFTSNLGLNRQVGVQFWGTLFDERLDYALSVINGPRNSYEDFNDDKDIMGYLNARPFVDRPEGSLLRLLNVGGSFAYGVQDNPLVPASFRVATNASNAGTADRAAPPFLIFNPGAIERGQRTFWSAHMAYFYRSLSVFADYNGAILQYATDPAAPRSAVLPTHGMSVAAGYFLTGEQLERRTIVEPLRPLDLRRGQFSPGAVELFGRYSTFDVDSNIFDAGLADPDLWSNRAWITNLGVNWYPNRFVKVILSWQHAEFGSPVVYALPDRKMLTNDMVWLRFQLYY